METHFSRVEEFIRLIRESFIGAEEVYTSGSCVRFALILKHRYPSGTILHSIDHTIFELDGKCYDINGLCKKEEHEPILNIGILHLEKILQIKHNINE